MHSFSLTNKSRAAYFFVMIFLLIIIVGLIGSIYSNRMEQAAVAEVDDIPVVNLNIDNIQSQESITAAPDAPIIKARLSSSVNSTITANNTPSVVIYHTHDCEAYKMTTENKYEEIAEARCADQNYSVVRVGKELLYQLNYNYGIKGIQDTSSHENPKLSTAYSRSLITASNYTNKYSDAVILDIHRDAYNKNSWDPKYVVIDGQRVARILIVVGKGEGYEDKPDYELNLKYANELTANLNNIHPDLAKPVLIKSGRYNQHLSDKCLLIEVGHHYNTLEEAIAATKYLSQAINETFFE